MNEIKLISTGTYSVSIDNTRYLGIATGLGNEILKTIYKNNFLSDSGLLWSKSGITNWPLAGITIHNNELIPYGGYLEGKTLADITVEKEELLNLTLFFYLLHETDRTPENIISTGLYFLEGNGILLFPVTILKLITAHQDDSYNMKYVEIYNHPEFKGEKALCFTLGVLAYKMTTGVYPFEGAHITEIHELMRRSKPVPPRFKNPELRADFSTIIMDSIFPTVKNSITLKKWVGILEKVMTEGEREDISTDKIRERKIKAHSLEKQRNVSFKRAMYLNKNWKRIVIGILSAVLIGIALSGPIRNALKPPVTKGYPPEKVVKLYYESINSLDVETLDDCVTGNAGKEDIKEVTGIFVVSKVRKGYEGGSGMVNASDWIKKGKPALKDSESLYGLTNIGIKRTGEDTFIAQYTRWRTDFPEKTDASSIRGKSVGIHMVDDIHLIKKQDTWYIDAIRRSTHND